MMFNTFPFSNQCNSDVSPIYSSFNTFYVFSDANIFPDENLKTFFTQGYTKLCSHPLLSTPIHVHSFSVYSHPPPLMFSGPLLILSPPLHTCSLSHLFPVHIQILLPNLIHHLPFQALFSLCVLRAYVIFNVNLCFFLFSVLFQKRLITLGPLTF